MSPALEGGDASARVREDAGASRVTRSGVEAWDDADHIADTTEATVTTKRENLEHDLRGLRAKKGRITGVGSVEGDVISGWAFDGGDYGVYVLSDGTQLLCGWSNDDLRLIAEALRDV